MECPICSDNIPEKVSTVSRKPEDVILQGKIYAVIDPKQCNTYTPYEDAFTVSLRPHQGPTKYLKFTEEEIKQHALAAGQRIRCHAHHLHVVDGSEIVFEIDHVSILGGEARK